MSHIHKSIKYWAEEDRPREKLIRKGKESLSSAELLAILLGSGSRKESALALAKRILSNGDGLGHLARQEWNYFTLYNGIGQAKAATIAAALELGRRRAVEPAMTKAQVSSSREAYDLLGPVLSDLKHEEFWISCLNRRNQLLSNERISSGGISATVVDPKIIFNKTLMKSASSIVLYHNHPSGGTKPSHEDLKLTRKIVEAGKLLEISVLDHLIIGNGGYLSFADEGLI